MSADRSTGQARVAALPAGLVVVQSPESEAAQAYRSVRETIRHARSDRPIRSVLLADTGSGDVTGEAAANIGASFALNGDDTVLIDLDAANPVLHEILGTPGSPGLIEWLSRSQDSESAVSIQPTGVDRLSLIPVGVRGDATSQASLADLMTDRSCDRLIADLGASAQYTLFHGSVAPVSSQALTVAAHVDGVVLIVRSGATRRTDAQRAKEALERVGANLLGVILTESS